MLIRGSAARTFGHAVLPVVLAGAAHHEQVAAPEVERAGLTAAAGPDAQRAGRADADDGHDRVVDRVAVAVAVPRDRVVAVAVAVEADRVERLGVARARARGASWPGSASPRAPARASTTTSGAARAGGAPTSSPCAGATAASRSGGRTRPARRPASPAGGRARTARRARCAAARRTTRRRPGRRLPNSEPCRCRSASSSSASGERTFADTCSMFAPCRRHRQGRADSPACRCRSTTRPIPASPTTSPSPTRRPAAASSATSCSSPRASTAIGRLLTSGHRMRSVLVTPQALARFDGALDDLDAPVYVAPKAVLAATVGFDLHRGAVAAADRRPLPSLAESPPARRRPARRPRGAQRPREPRRRRPLGAGVRRRRARARPGVHRPVLPAHGAGQHGRGAAPARRPGDDVAGRPRRAARRRLRDVGADARRRRRRPVGARRSRPRVAVLLGAEGPGLSAAAMAAVDRRVRIPIAAGVDSLNVGHAAAVAFAHLSRRSPAPRRPGGTSRRRPPAGP